MEISALVFFNNCFETDRSAGLNTHVTGPGLTEKYNSFRNGIHQYEGWVSFVSEESDLHFLPWAFSLCWCRLLISGFDPPVLRFFVVTNDLRVIKYNVNLLQPRGLKVLNKDSTILRALLKLSQFLRNSELKNLNFNS